MSEQRPIFGTRGFEGITGPKNMQRCAVHPGPEASERGVSISC